MPPPVIAKLVVPTPKDLFNVKSKSSVEVFNLSSNPLPTVKRRSRWQLHPRQQPVAHWLPWHLTL